MSNKAEAIDKMKPPSSLRNVQVFLGMMGYYRQFIPDFAAVSKPLVQLLRSVPFEWTESQQQAFEDLKDRLRELPFWCIQIMIKSSFYILMLAIWLWELS